MSQHPRCATDAGPTAAARSVPAEPGRPVRLHAHADEAALVRAVVGVVLETIADDRRRSVGSLLLLSGGGTPVPVYRALAAPLRALSGDAGRLTVSLVDERWVAPDDDGSNARMIRSTLFGSDDGARGGGRFWPLVDWNRGLQASVDQANARLLAAPESISLVLYGMGDDGHTASLFPASADLSSALQATAPYVALDASGCPGAGAWPQRITLTPRGWKPARRRLLLLRGANKRRLFERALRERDAQALPICAAIAVGDAPLEVHWAP